MTNGRNWGGARLGAGRPRTETLDVSELRMLYKLLAESSHASEYAATMQKLHRLAQKGLEEQQVRHQQHSLR